MNTGPPRFFRQLPLDLAADGRHAREDLVVGRLQRCGGGADRRLARLAGAGRLLLAGPSGAGKSHMGAVWRERSGAADGQPGHIGQDALEAAARGPVFIDDADSAPLDEQGLFHLINTVRGAGTHLMMTARRFPASWPVCACPTSSRG